MLTKAEIDALIQEHFQVILDRDEWHRASNKPEPDWRTGPERFFIEHLGITDEDIQNAIQRSGKSAADIIYDEMLVGDEDQYRAMLADREWEGGSLIADELLREKNIKLSPDSTEYRLLCLGMMRAQHEALRILRGRSQGDWSLLPRDPHFRVHSNVAAPTAAKVNVRPGKSLAELVIPFIKEHSRSGVQKKWVNDMQTALNWFVNYCGEEKSISTITKSDVVEYKNALAELAPRWTQRFKGVSIKEAVELSRKGTFPQADFAALNGKRLGPIEQFFHWAKDNDYIQVNPAKNVRLPVSKKSARKVKRDPFNAEQLNRIFRAPTFIGAESNYYWKKPGSTLIRDGHYWVPLVALFTGCRRRELCQMLTSDVVEVDGTWALSINDLPDENEKQIDDSKSLKNADSRRDIPIHPELERLGFLEHLAERKCHGHRHLFECNPGERGDYDPISKWFGRFLDSLNIRSRRLVFHSFRNTFENAMLENISDYAARFQLGGRTRIDSASMYANKYSIKRLREELVKIKYPGLDLSHLHSEQALKRMQTAE